MPASEDPADRRRRTKAENSVRTNALGEALPAKESSLRTMPRAQYLAAERELAAELGGALKGARRPLALFFSSSQVLLSEEKSLFDLPGRLPESAHGWRCPVSPAGDSAVPLALCCVSSDLFFTPPVR